MKPTTIAARNDSAHITASAPPDGMKNSRTRNTRPRRSSSDGPSDGSHAGHGQIRVDQRVRRFDFPNDDAVAGDFFDDDGRAFGDQLAVADAIDQLVAELHLAGGHQRRHRHAALALQVIAA